MREMTVTANDAGQRVDRFLQKALPLLPSSLAQKYIRLKRIKVNGKRTEQKYRLNEGDVLQLYINDEFFAENPSPAPYLTLTQPKLSICYEDSQILIVIKPPDMLCHSGEIQGEPTLVDHLKAYLYQSGAWRPEEEQSFVPALANRLDHGTGGLVLAAKTAPALKMLNEKIRMGEVHKFYLLAVHGKPSPPSGRLEGYLQKDEQSRRVAVTDGQTQGAKSAVTEYHVLETKGGLSLVECQLITGRTHQIRAQMAHLGTPILGDKKYGSQASNSGPKEPHQALWAHRVRFAFSTDADVLNYLSGQEFTTSEIPFLTKYFPPLD